MSFDDSRGNPDPPYQPRQWVKMPALCEHLHCDVNTAARYIKAGMPAHQPITRGAYLFDLAQVDAWIDSRCTSRAAGDVA